MEEKEKIEYMDLLYFGSAGEQGQQDFMKKIKEKFPNVEFKDAFDDIKGFRQEVFMEKSNEDNYYAWLIGNGWFECSFSFQSMMMSSGVNYEQKALCEKYIALAKEQYPQNFKSESSNKK